MYGAVFKKRHTLKCDRDIRSKETTPSSTPSSSSSTPSSSSSSLPSSSSSSPPPSSHHSPKNHHSARFQRKDQDSKATKVVYFNARSIRNKLTDLDVLLKTSRYEIVFITETWLQTTDLSSTIVDSQNYTIIRTDRSTHAGGVAAIYSNDIAENIVVHTTDSTNQIGFELLSFDFHFTSRKYLRFVCVYLPPKSSNDKDVVSNLLKTLKQLVTNKEVYVVGDFNFGKYNWTSNTMPSNQKPLKKFILFLEDYCLTQLITSPTHNSGSTLDLFLTSHPDNISNINLLEPFTNSCDHNAIEIDIDHRLRNKPITAIPKINFYAADYEKINRYLSTID